MALQTAISRQVMAVVRRAHVSQYASVNRSGQNGAAPDEGDDGPTLWRFFLVNVKAFFSLVSALSTAYVLYFVLRGWHLCVAGIITYVHPLLDGLPHAAGSGW